MSMFTKEELDEVLKRFGSRFKHIEPHVILILYAYFKMEALKEMKQ